MTSLSDSNCCSEPVSYAAVEEDGTSGLVIEVFGDLGKVGADVACANLENIPGLEPSSVITEPSYFKLVTISSFCPFTLISVLMPLVLFVIS